MFFNRPTGHKLVDRGDPSNYDYSVIDFTIDGAYHELDLSLIVPKGALAVLVQIEFICSAPDLLFRFRKLGNSYEMNCLRGNSDKAMGVNTVTGIVFCDSDRIIEYKLGNGVWLAFYFTVCGWFI